MNAIVRHVAVILLTLAAAGVCARSASAQGIAKGDFNGDGQSDLAIGVPDEDLVVNGVTIVDAGAVTILYGGAGAVHVFYGSSMGMVGLSLFGGTLVTDVVWHRDSGSVLDTADAGDNFGWSLAAGNFNGDRYADLAIGVPYDDAVQTNSGSVHALYGFSSGLVASDQGGTAGVNEDDQVWHQNTGTIATAAEPDDFFGWSLAAGDFDRDGYADLAVGIPGESIGRGTDVNQQAAPAGPKGAGAVLVNGQNVGALKRAALPYLRRNLGLVFQDQKLLYDRSVFDNVMLPPKSHILGTPNRNA